jgi:WD40 repeat protein
MHFTKLPIALSLAVGLGLTNWQEAISFQGRISFTNTYQQIKNHIFLALKQNTINQSKKNSSRDWSKATIIYQLEEHKTPITLLSFSSDGRWLASADSQSIFIWEVATGKLQQKLSGHYSPQLKMAIAPTAIAFSPDGNLIASSTWSQGLFTPEKSLTIWNWQTGKAILSLNGKQGCQQIAFSTDAKKLFTACGLGIQVWQLETRKQLFNFASDSAIATFALNPKDEIIATTQSVTDTNNSQIKLWQLTKTGATLLTTLEGHHNQIAQLAFTADGKKLVSSSYDGTIKFWNWEKKKEWLSPLQTSSNGLFSLTPDGRTLAGNFTQGTILDLIRQQVILTPVPLNQKASTVAFSPDGNMLAWAGQTANNPHPLIRLWQAENAENKDNSSESARVNYEPLNLNDWWGERSPTQTPSTGSDPVKVAVSALGIKEKSEAEQEKVEVLYPENNQAIVTITQTHLADDSVFGIKYRVEFTAISSQPWQVIWAGKQYRCYPGRGHQEWSSQLCH